MAPGSGATWSGSARSAAGARSSSWPARRCLLGPARWRTLRLVMIQAWPAAPPWWRLRRGRCPGGRPRRTPHGLGVRPARRACGNAAAGPRLHPQELHGRRRGTVLRRSARRRDQRACTAGYRQRPGRRPPPPSGLLTSRSERPGGVGVDDVRRQTVDVPAVPVDLEHQPCSCQQQVAQPGTAAPRGRSGRTRSPVARTVGRGGTAAGSGAADRGRRRPRLRRARRGVGHGRRELVTVEPAEELGQASAERAGGIESSATFCASRTHPWRMSPAASSALSCGHTDPV